MKLKEAQEKLGLTDAELAEYEFDPTRIVVSRNFRRPWVEGELYRIRSIEELIKRRVDFASDCNLHYDMVLQLIRIVCPQCKHEMTPGMGGGNGSTSHVVFNCKACKIDCTLTTPSNGISLRFE